MLIHITIIFGIQKQRFGGDWDKLLPQMFVRSDMKVFPLHSTVPMMIQISGKGAHLAKKC